MSRLLTIVFAALVAVVSVQAVAQTAMPRVEERVQIAHDRINDGFRVGDLTEAETDRLRRDLAEVERMMRRARRDGVATADERRDIRDRMTVVERDIERLITNRRRR